MRFFIPLVGFATLVAAAPHPQGLTSIVIADPTLSLPLSTSLNIPTTDAPSFPTTTPLLNTTSSTSRRRHPHSEPIPIFSKSCDCPKLATVQYPCWATDAVQACNFEELHSWVCWTSANYGCPSPTRDCPALYTPTPWPGKYHPCDLGPHEPETTPTPTLTLPPTIIPTLTPTLNATLTPTFNATLTPTLNATLTGIVRL